MLVLTTDTIPDSFRVTHLHGTITAATRVAVHQRGLVDTMLKKTDGTVDDGLSELIKTASTLHGANCIFGIRVTSTFAAFSNGAYIYYTYHATVAQIDETA